MTQKTPCPFCGQMNYEHALVCWACGKPLVEKAPRSVPRPATSSPAEPLSAAELALLDQVRLEREAGAPAAPPPPVADAASPDPEAVLAPPQTTILADTSPPAATLAAPDLLTQTGPPSDAPAAARAAKLAEMEAAALRDKDYVTAPVDVEEGPRSLGDWVAFAVEWARFRGVAFKESLDEYDARRGRKSGTFSSFGCLAAGVALLLLALLIAWGISMWAGPRAAVGPVAFGMPFRMP